MTDMAYTVAFSLMSLGRYCMQTRNIQLDDSAQALLETLEIIFIEVKSTHPSPVLPRHAAYPVC